MASNGKVKVPVWYWIVSIVALIWNLIGAMAYLGQAFITDEMKAAMPAEQLALMENTPAWATAAFAFAVWGGVLGCIALLLRKKWAKMVLMVSLLGILIQLGYSYFMTNAVEVYGTAQGVVMPIVLIVIGVGLVVFANSAQKKLWIN
ncbi:hypothetical protein HZY62_17805 [Maribacter polysiphoniae]|uniref:Sugar transporter n=1 Tax=Maribacter polysiphoniae TaxID=429344 RepID=A0A316EE89_9FLAO|nr:hypothetical protein [Maribacter polysiphoniae]MBD1262458.1 hypothetical protein [Maribacter polysiphoniae]PWK21290.1 hypothetical protein LX92_03794 [Maribacter polysiphoniae]